MSWQSYVDSIMDDADYKDAAIVGIEGKTVWASVPGGTFCNITSEEIDRVLSKDREDLFTNGLTLGSMKCQVLKDNLDKDGDWTMLMATINQSGHKLKIAVGKSTQALVFAMGN